LGWLVNVVEAPPPPAATPIDQKISPHERNSSFRTLSWGVLQEALVVKVKRRCKFLIDHIKQFYPKFKHKRSIRDAYLTYDLFEFEVHLVDNCNLKCKMCDHFACLTRQKNEISPEVLKKDLSRIDFLTSQKKFKNGIVLKILGGEPLLHSDVVACLKAARTSLPTATIKFVTNGILLHKQNENFWNALRDFDILLCPTAYPINLDYQYWENYAKNRDVKFEFFPSKTEARQYKMPLDLQGGQNPKLQFDKCMWKHWGCFLYNSKIYPCCKPPLIWAINEKFCTDFPLDEKDGIDIYSAKNLRQILKHLRKPIPFCKYCNVAAMEFGHQWGVTSGKLEEWT
jgi:hypothetical protein